jgi:hypothetical protein
MESMSYCGCVPSAAELMEQAILIVSASKKYCDSLKDLRRTVINKLVELKDRSLGNNRKYFREYRINTADSDKRITTGYVTTQPM